MFRSYSETEIRWCVFFNVCNIRYEHNPECVVLQNKTLYYPSFYLPDFDVYADVVNDLDDVVSNFLDNIKNIVTWGGPIKELVILSDIPGDLSDGGMWHFPEIHWDGHGLVFGWWFFAQREDNKAYGKMSGCSNRIYPSWHRPWLTNVKTSVKAVSDTQLKNESVYKSYYENADKEDMLKFGWSKEEVVKENTSAQYQINGIVFDAFKKARKVNFVESTPEW